ncbi:hypothetical protein C8Q77DRAFT_1073322 [Trametes polyzona]|nr:hypothetical protein C8Q77DRAFT_1073322 [Trametes polyzona]
MSNTPAAVGVSSQPSSGALPEPRKDRYRVLGILAKKPELTDEEFFKHWREVHGPLFAGLDIVKKNILKYEQHLYNDSFEAGILANGYALTGQCRGIAVFEAESYEKILEVFASEEYKQHVYPDEANFTDRSKSVFYTGSLVTFIDQS